jgi:hypothetical protein
MENRKSLTQLLQQSDRASLARAWTETTAAEELSPLPAGTYRCLVLEGALFSARTGTLGYKLTFEVADGEHAGRRVWHDLWLTPAAMAISKRDLAKLGIDQLDQLERPLPEGIVVDARVVLRRDDDGTERNRVARFEVVAVGPPAPDPFAPAGEAGTDPGSP